MRKVQIAFLVLCLIILPSLAQETTWELTETLRVRGTGWTTYLINYPTGWQTDNAALYTRFGERGVDMAHAADDRFAVEGYMIVMERFRPREMQDLGVVVNAPITDVIAYIGETREFATNVELQETSFLAAPALSLRTTDARGNHLYITAGYHGIVFEMVTIFAPSAEALDTFLPTWEAMLASINIEQGSVQLEDYSLSFECKGEGSPTVILESGWGQSSSYWGRVFNELDDTTRVCSINRNHNIGMNMQQHIDDLYQALNTANIVAPYVMVGHSYGGGTIRLFAAQHPGTVAAMIFVDSMHENQINRFAEITEWERDPVLDVSLEQLRLARDFGDMPIVVLTAENPMSALADPTDILIQSIWVEELQTDLATLSTNSRQIIVEWTNHMTIIDDPITAASILEMVELVQATSQ
jgi:hypothetical protein